MKIEGEFQVVEVGRMSSGRSDVVLSICGPGAAVQMRIEGIDRDQSREIAAMFGEPVRVSIEISKVTPP